jgi:hypothetical protein
MSVVIRDGCRKSSGKSRNIIVFQYFLASLSWASRIDRFWVQFRETRRDDPGRCPEASSMYISLTPSKLSHERLDNGRVSRGKIHSSCGWPGRI